MYFFALRTDLKRFWLSFRPSTSALSIPSFANAFTASFVDGFAGVQASTTTSALSWLRLLIAARSAAFRTFFGTWYSWSRIFGAIALPPPTHWLARMEPWRARPVPFCLYGFFPPPETSDRFLTPTVPARREASWPLTISSTRGSPTG